MTETNASRRETQNAGACPGIVSAFWPALPVFVVIAAFLLHFGLNTRSFAETPSVDSPTNGILLECWTNVAGIPVHSLTDSPNYPLKPDSATLCTNFETSSYGEENYGERLRGWLVPPVTGDYTFWIASDDTSELWLSSDDNPAHKHRLARVSFYTGPRDWSRYLEQRSDLISLKAGKRYYIEALHKQGPGVAHLSVAWQIPGKGRELIAGQWLQPWNGGHSGEGATLEIWTNAIGSTNMESPDNISASVKQVVGCFAPAVKDGKTVHQCLRGYLHPPSSGDYVFSIQGGRLFLSTNDVPANQRAITSNPVRLEAGESYYFEALQENPAQTLVIGWQPPQGTNEHSISGRYLTPYDSDYDGMPDWWERRHNLNPYDPDDALADSDGDGLCNVEEFRRGSNPRIATTFPNLPPILSVKQIREPARSRPIHAGEPVQLRGAVTYSFNNRDFFVQDGTGGIYVEARNTLTNRLAVGDVVEVNGTLAGEDASPNVILDRLKILGSGVLPTARSVAIDPLHEGLAGIVDFVGNADDERVEIQGIVRSAALLNDWINGRNLVLKMITTGGEFDIRCPETGSHPMESWIDASIRVRGVASMNPQQHSVGLIIYAPQLKDLYVEAAPSGNLFETPMHTVRSLIQFYWHDVGHRVGIEGTVLYSEPGKMLFVRDETGAMQVFTTQREIAHRGDQVHVVGFPAPGDYAAVLKDAIFEKTGGTATADPAIAKPEQILDGKLNCDLVTLRGTLVDHVFGSDKQGFWVKTGDTLFDAYWLATNGLPAASQFEKDSVVKLTGIALVQDSGLAKSPQTFHLLLPSEDAVTVLKQPPWLTSRRLFWTSAILAGSILLGLAWVAFLSKKKNLLEAEVVRRKRAEKDLQQAHEELEKRMTAELHDEISRREKSEAEFQAVLKERTRIAQELHDTLEQGLVGIALQLDNVADVVRDDVGQAQAHLESARRLVEHSQAETRRSVWDLRSQTLEEGGLQSALESVAAEMRAGASIPVEVVAQGTPVPLLVLIENNLFRIGQEALTNALKHARAGRISVLLEYLADAVVLEVQDDGTGFDADHPAADGHHFGLQGMRERVKRLGGLLEIKSAPNAGTQIRVRVPLPAVKLENQNPDDNTKHSER